jgi:predicted HTH domain antitoxin
VEESVIEIQVPTPLLHYGLDRDEIQRRVTEWLVISLFVDERISSGKAASFLNMSRVDFLVLLRRAGIAYVDYTNEEIADELAAVQQLQVPTQT